MVIDGDDETDEDNNDDDDEETAAKKHEASNIKQGFYPFKECNLPSLMYCVYLSRFSQLNRRHL
jgi:hypothetical protein